MPRAQPPGAGGQREPRGGQGPALPGRWAQRGEPEAGLGLSPSPVMVWVFWGSFCFFFLISPSPPPGIRVLLGCKGGQTPPHSLFYRCILYICRE